MAPRPARLVADDLASCRVAGVRAAQAAASALRQFEPRWEVVAGLDSVVVQFDPARFDAGQVLERLEAACARPPGPAAPQVAPLDLPVRYGGADGPDLGACAARLDLQEDELIARHSARVYTVDLIGFTPGFAYCGGLDPGLSTARLATPRLRVAAGSVGLGTGQTGLYALDGPGGWPIIGTVQATLFDPGAADPFRLKPGMAVRFSPA